MPKLELNKAWLLNYSLKNAGFFLFHGRLEYGTDRLLWAIRLDTGMKTLSPVVIAKGPDEKPKINAPLPAKPFVGGGARRLRSGVSFALQSQLSPDFLNRFARIFVPEFSSEPSQKVGGGGRARLIASFPLGPAPSRRLMQSLVAVDGFVEKDFGIYFGWDSYRAFHPVPKTVTRTIAAVPIDAGEAIEKMLTRLCDGKDYLECANLARFILAKGEAEKALALAKRACDEEIATGCEVQALALAKLGKMEEAKEIAAPLCQGRTPCRILASIEPPVVKKKK